MTDLDTYADHLETEILGLHAELESIHPSRWQTPYAQTLLIEMDSHVAALNLLAGFRARETVPALLQDLLASSASATRIHGSP